MKKNIIFVALFISVLLVGCIEKNTKVDLSTWDEAQVYDYLNEVYQYVREIPLETQSKEEIIKMYEKYFTPELSRKIVDSLYIFETDYGWMVPDGDGGYMFIVPTGQYDGSEVSIEFGQEYIRVREFYEIGMYSAIEYKIEYLNRPIITDWKQQ